MVTKFRVFTSCLVFAFLVGCPAARTQGPTNLRDAKSPVLALHTPQTEIVVSVSPVRQSVQIFSNELAVIGAVADAAVNQKYRDMVLKALDGYDAGKVFETRVNDQLAKAVPGLGHVAAITSTAGFQTRRDAEQAFYKQLAREGHDMLLDLDMTYGIFGYEGILVAKLQGKLVSLHDNTRLWMGTIVASSEPVLATDKLSDPTKQMGPNITSPRLVVEKGAVTRWTQDGGRLLKQRYESAVDGAVSALLNDLNLKQDAVGQYYLGKTEMNRKRFKRAEEHFRKAIELDPKFLDAQNARAVNLARMHHVKEAVEICNNITQAHPDYAPAWYNLAWWYAKKIKDPAKARSCYDKALALGMTPEKKLEKAVNKK